MALPKDPAPSSVNIRFSGLGTRSKSVSNKRSQVRSRTLMNFGFTLSYSDLSFDERNLLTGYVLEQGMSPFRVTVPTYSENSNLLSSTLSPSASFSKGTKEITFSSVLGEFKPMNLIRITGRDLVHVVTTVDTKSGGNQTVRIQPPLFEDVTTSTVFEVKDVEVNMTLSSSTLEAASKGFQASTSLELIQDIDDAY